MFRIYLHLHSLSSHSEILQIRRLYHLSSRSNFLALYPLLILNHFPASSERSISLYPSLLSKYLFYPSEFFFQFSLVKKRGFDNQGDEDLEKKMVIGLCRAALIIPPPDRLIAHRKLALRSISISKASRRYLCAGSMEAPPEGYRKNVGICLANSSMDKIFSASRLDIPSAWQMPQGGIDEGEDPRNAAIRELKEETGVRSAEIISEIPFWLTYDFPPEVKAKLNKQWGTNWNGQAQKWFLFRLTGGEDEIDLAGDGSEKPEFGEWRWLTPNEVIDQAVAFKKPVYADVLEVFAPHFR